MRPAHLKSSLARVLDSMQVGSALRLAEPVAPCNPTLLDEYGDERLTAADHDQRRRRASAVIKYQNRHVVAYSLRATRGMTDHKIALYLDVDIPRARQMMVIGLRLLMDASVKARFPDLALMVKRSEELSDA